MLDPSAKTTVLARGLPASPGAASGKVVFSADEAESFAARGEAVILVRIETSPEDIHGMHAAKGVLTTRGGMTSHAAVVARGMGRPCVAGAGDLRIDYEARTMTARATLVKAGEIITIDGSTGEVMVGEVPTIQPELSGDFATLMGWADAIRRLKVRANAETAIDARAARRFGAEGIGLSRTEHMFFEADRIGAMRRVIMAEDEAGRRAGLADLLPIQREDFAEIFRIMKGLPVTIRLLDPPLHEFLPKTEAEFGEMARLTGKDVAAIRHRALALHETNPMLGHRGCRLGITYPEIYEMQAAAIFEAAVAVVKETGEAVEPEIMVPLIATKKEFDILKAMIDRVGKEVMEREGTVVPYLVGTMIELPRAALLAGEIAETAEFFSFGTNDLTQTVFGLSRDDAASFVGTYQRLGIFEHDPFVTLDVTGVGELVRIAAERGPRHPAGTEARHLRRAWRRSGFDRVLPRDRARLRLVLALPRADRPPGRGASRAVGRVGERNGMRAKTVAICLATLAGIAGAAAAQTKGIAGAAAAADHLFGPDPGAAGAADQSRAGHRAAGRAVAVADGTRAGIPDPRTGDAGLSGAATPRPDRAAEHAILPQQSARSSNGSSTATASARGANAAAKSSSS